MSKVCQLTGKKAMVGNNVSHSNKRTKRKFQPNVHKKKFYVPELKRHVTLTVSSRALRTITKKGLYNYLKELEHKGIKVIK